MPATTKRDDIFNSALTLFAERGYDATTIPMIATDAKVGAGTIYRYFKNKEVLVNTLFQHYVQLFQDTLSGDREGTGTVREQFHFLFRGMVRFTDDHPHALYFIKMHNAAYFLDEKSKGDFQELTLILQQFLDEGKAAGHIRNLPTKALIAIVFGAFLELHQLVRSGGIDVSEELLTGVEESCWDAVRHHK